MAKIIIIASIAFAIGFVLGVSILFFRSGFGYFYVLDETDDKIRYNLELVTGLDDLPKRKNIIFKVINKNSQK